MSYCRNNGRDSDVYVIASGGGLECFCDPFFCLEPATMITHLERHRERGDKVPDYAFERLHEEAAARLAEGEPNHE